MLRCSFNDTRYQKHQKSHKTRATFVSLALFFVALCVLCMLHISTTYSRRLKRSVDKGGEELHYLQIRRALLQENVSQPSAGSNQFPAGIFSNEQIRQGAVVLYIIGMVYMFVALAIICDEFFVPSLDVITKQLNISEDVAGATFMAAGGSAPELFTSVIGVFITKNDVGIGTIVGSAVFNILFVIAMCVVFSRSVLVLTWWPLFRDTFFYSVALILLVVFFTDNKIFWWEALTLFACYVVYCLFMKWNTTLEKFVKMHCLRKRVGDNVQSSVDMNRDTINVKTRRRSSTPIIHNGSKFRQGLLQLMIHSIDPLNRGTNTVDMQTITSINMIMNKSLNSIEDSKQENSNLEFQTQDSNRENIIDQDKFTNINIDRHDNATDVLHYQANLPIKDSICKSDIQKQEKCQKDDTAMLEEEPTPLDLSWPSNRRKQITYVIVAPIVILLYITLPDCRRPEKRKFYILTFLGSIIWIGIFSYLMVWFASVMSDTMEIPPEITGMTVLAAGTSVPDLITSVIVARKGFGDMAVSSSIGSNIFDVCVGLPIPWLLDSLAKLIVQLTSASSMGVQPIPVNSEGMACNILLLFFMLLLIIICIACFDWKMNKKLGIAMLLLYVLFLSVALLFELHVLKCKL